MNYPSHESATIAFFFLSVGFGVFDVLLMFLATHDAHKRDLSDWQIVYWRIIALVFFPVGLIAYFIYRPKLNVSKNA
jgi:hypothetical protein